MAEPSLEELAENVNNPQFGDDRLGVLFYTRVVEDAAATLQEGRKIFKEREYIKIMVPGDRLNIIDRPAQKTGTLPTDDALRFPKQYSRFKNQQQQVAHDGTPLTLWPGVNAALAEELKYINIFTVEQLAQLADNYASRIPKGYELKAKAAEFVQALKDQGAVNRMQAELEQRDNEIEALKAAVAEQAAQIKELLAANKRK
jgi:hypothetical protein